MFQQLYSRLGLTFINLSTYGSNCRQRDILTDAMFLLLAYGLRALWWGRELANVLLKYRYISADVLC